MRGVRHLTVASIVLAALACASSQGGQPGVVAAGQERVSANVLTTEEIASGQWQNAYELIQSLRPRWLRAHGAESIHGETPDIQVYYDANHLGGLATLRGITVQGIASIHFIDPVTAAARWGGDHANGAIVISTR